MDGPTSPLPSCPTKTRQKQWLEALGTLHYVLAVIILGERRGEEGCSMGRDYNKTAGLLARY